MQAQCSDYPAPYEDETWQEIADHQLDHDPTPGQCARKAALQEGA